MSRTNVTIPGWAFGLAGPLVFLASLFMSYAVQGQTVKESERRISQLESKAESIETVKRNLARICERLQVHCEE